MSQSNLVELARNVAKAQEALDRALEALWAATGRPSRATKPRPGPKAVGGVSISKAVLDRILAGPAGETRANLILSLGHPDAVSSALKKHRAAGRIQPVGGGRWTAAAADAQKKKARS